MKLRKNAASLFLLCAFALLSGSAVMAQDKSKDEAMDKDKTMSMDKEKSMDSHKMMDKEEAMKMDEAKAKQPVVAIISAEWCPYCKRVEPVIAGLMKDYSDKLNFVVFDVTNETTTAEAMKKAEAMGLGKFFKENKNKTSTVAVLKNKEVVYKTSNNGKHDDYVAAFDKALN